MEPIDIITPTKNSFEYATAAPTDVLKWYREQRACPFQYFDNQWVTCYISVLPIPILKYPLQIGNFTPSFLSSMVGPKGTYNQEPIL
jgi:hypothetical protein